MTTIKKIIQIWENGLKKREKVNMNIYSVSRTEYILYRRIRSFLRSDVT